MSKQQLHRLAAAAEVGSEHQLSQAVVPHTQELGVTIPRADRFHSITGKGVGAWVDGREVTVGNRALMSEIGITLNGPPVTPTSWPEPDRRRCPSPWMDRMRA